MKRTFLVGVAAGALLAGVNLASAQMMDRQPAASGGASVEQKGSGGGLQQKGRAGAEIKADSPGGKARAQAPDNMKADTKGQAGDDMKADTKGRADTKGQARDNMKADTKAQGAQKQNDKARNAQSKPEPGKGAASADSDSKSKSSTTAQGGGSAGNKTLTTEQKTKIRQTVIKSGPRVTNVNFSISVGTVVPRTVKFAPLPTVLVEIYPEWRGYDYFVVGEEIIIVEPKTYKIVTVLRV